MSEENHPYQVRTANAADNILLAEIGAETFADSFGADNSPENMSAYLAQSFNPAKQAEELSDPATKFLLVEQQGSVLGFARVRFGPAPAMVQGAQPMEIVRLYARKPWIGRGVGARLMQACLEEAQRAGCDVVWLDVWEHNPRAIAFYRKWSFEVVGTQAFQLGEELQTDLLMLRRVKAETSST